MVTSYIKTAWRHMLRNKTSAAINLVGLTVGMTASLFIFMWVKNELSYDSFHPDAGNIYRIKSYIATGNGSTWVWEASPYMLGEAIREELPEVEVVTRISTLNPAIRVNGEFFQEKNVACVDEHWFDMFHYDFVRGSAAAFNSGIYHVAVTESGARKYFGISDPIGKTMRIDTADFVVQAVLKDYPANSSFRHDLLLPLAARRANPKIAMTDSKWGSFNFRTFIKIAPSALLISVSKGIGQIMDVHRENNNATVGLISLREMHFEDDLQTASIQLGNRETVKIFTALGVLILVIACINYVNLTTARALHRSKEVSVKKIVGAGRTSLFLQFVLESILFVGMTILVTILLANGLMPVFNSLTENRFELPLWSAGLWGLIGITVAIIVLLISIYPAFLLSSFRPLSAFRGSNALQIKGNFLRQALVVVQFTASVVLIIGTIVIYNQMSFINSENESYDKSQVLSFIVPFQAMSHYDTDGRKARLKELKHEFLTGPGISKVSYLNGSVVNMQSYSSGAADWDGREQDFNPNITFFEVTDGFNEILNLELTAGRWFLPGSKADNNNVILNETAVKTLGIREPVIGQRFEGRGDSGVIIGIVKDFYYKSLREKIDPAVIKTYRSGASHFLVQTMPGKNIEAQQAAERVWKSNFPGIPFSYTFLNDDFDRLYKEERRSTTLILLFAVLASVVSVLGLYGLATFRAESRTKEIGIRKVLGASVSNIVRLLSRDFVKLVLISVIIASPIAWWAMNNWLDDFAYRIDIQWWMFAAAGLAAVAIALFTISFQAIRAATANPVESLRTE
ncbi:MAG: hypothetical protein ABS46_03115 [Cytophagaceae bacterium SCN 52-12]|nr:MAG: hypothetical protein ABS46_03115 [Cytophagaceae bacterium SCN 52-12]